MEQKAEIERLNKKEAEDQQAIALLETRLKNNEGMCSALREVPQHTLRYLNMSFYFDLAFRLTEQLAKRPSIDSISAELEVLKAEHASLQNFFKESTEKETKAKRELEEKHVQAMSELAEKLKASNQRVKNLVSQAKAYEAEASDIDELIFRKDFIFPASPLHSFCPTSETDRAIVISACLGFEWTKDSGLARTEAYEEARNSIDDLFEACRGIAETLSLKKARTTIIDKMTKLMKLVPDLIRDWQESSARGAASITLSMCKSYFPAMDFATVARGVPKGTNVKKALAETEGFDTLFAQRVNHSAWYEKHALPAGFSDDEDDEEGSGSSAHRSDDDSGDGSGKDGTYQASEDDPASSE